MFVLLFRECMNEYGWQKKQENLKILQDERIEVPEEALKHRMPDGSKPSTMHAAQLTLQYLASKVREGTEDFCKVNNGDMMPEICNEFVTIFIEQHKSKID
jgi:hypothetical protein